ncbi:GCD1 Nucleoside-diphosphate-sugar pyrophosphorylase involved in lipopolysaccharide biosynthesis/translation initiation factor 2B, gamma/epsilon subunits (eIF-2Bgamma/eIF-2Bepsilon) [Candidatus Nanopelagicaceae bacterium]
MKVIILAGGLGTRLSEETENKPKPMVLVDDKPILWHLMNIFSVQGFNDFVLALGYRGDVIKRWLLDLNDLSGDIRINTLSKELHHLRKNSELSWDVTALETGLNTQTGGRIAQCMKSFPGERVIATYGDGLANVDLMKLIAFHESHGKLATVTAVRPPARFGNLEIEGSRVSNFGEKNQSDAGWINGGFFVLEPEVANYVHDDSEPFESGALPRLVKENQLMAYHHDDFWQPMDTLREKQELSKYATMPIPPWLRFSHVK